MKIIKTITLLILTITLFSCKKEAVEVRKLGDDTLSFYVDGKLWQNDASGSSVGTPIDGMFMYYNNSQDCIGIYGKQFDANSMIYITLKGRDNTTYTLNNYDNNIAWGIEKSWINKIGFLYEGKEYGSKEGEGEVNIIDYQYTIDDGEVKSQNLEGNFEAILYNIDDPSDSIKLTDGRFND